jgi:large subunit ribosomal protein L3
LCSRVATIPGLWSRSSGIYLPGGEWRKTYARTRGLKGDTTMKNIIGRKVGMTSVFTTDGRSVPVTVIEAGPCPVVQRKTLATDGYEAVALAFGAIKKARVTRAMAGHYKKANLEPRRVVREFRRGIDGVELGTTITVEQFAEGDRVDVVGVSKGHGFAGGIKRWNFSGGGASHGSMIHRQPASNGDTNAGHTHRGSRRPGHFGVDRVTHQNLEVVRADAERNLLLVRGPVPGPKNGLVTVSLSVKSKASA